MQDHNCNQVTPLFTRRDVLRLTGCGFGAMAFAGVASTSAPASPLEPKQPPLRARAKRVLFLCMRGGPSHVDMFDYKPKLAADTGKPGPRPGSRLYGSRWKFAQHGQSGLWISELMPELAQHADQLCFVHSMQTDLPAHPQAFIRLHTGTSQFIRPSMGAWTLYGLGTENQNLPGFVSITPPSGFGGAMNYGSAFLPAIYQGTRIGNDNRPIGQAEVANLRPRTSAADQRAELDFVQSLNRDKAQRDQANPEVDGIIESYELAFRMQSEMPAVMDLSKEPEATKELYGFGDRRTADMGRKCLLARRMLEAGVRFVEISHGNWDHHFNLSNKLPESCAEIDRPIAGLLTDLDRRGLLKETLVVWSGEFGRTPFGQGQDGRDHNNKAFTLWMAGGGVRGGTSYGRSDDYGWDVAEHPAPIHDLHATMLAILGFDHKKLTFRHAGRDFRLTDVAGRVMDGVLA